MEGGKPNLPGSTGSRRELPPLALAAITALEEARLVEEARQVQARVLARNPDMLFEPVPRGRGASATFKPMVELLLCEIRAVASSGHLPVVEKKARIAWALEMAGF